MPSWGTKRNDNSAVRCPLWGHGVLFLVLRVFPGPLPPVCEPVSLAGFGTFSCRHRNAREGRNPITGKVMSFAASNTPVFKAAKAFKDKVNG
ncbi:MAG: HU family DNA-binding protein [Victivallales bacterium]|nr:HU family DNA-binding protein [Victivallales bacterium]